MQKYDVVIIGASFSGLSLAHHLPTNLSVLVVDAKPEAGSTVESTGLITSKTREEFQSFFPIDAYITNPISSICVVEPSYKDYFISNVEEPWIYQTDTKALVKAVADLTPPNVEVRTKTVFLGVEGDPLSEISRIKIQTQGCEPENIETSFLVGADGSRSKVASTIPTLSQNDRFLFGYEQVFFGDVKLGENPAETIYHFWFGAFSLGYGGWLSPTIVNGKNAFRVGLAKLEKDRGQAKELTEAFVRTLVEKNIVSIDGEVNEPGYIFGSFIPINGVLKTVSHKNVLLIGDAAGLCGAFAADGIKGSVVSAKIAGELIPRYLSGEKSAPGELLSFINKKTRLIDYYKRQVLYRRIWDLMKSDRTFRAMFNIIKSERETFLNQFCDSKDKRRSLAWTVLKIKYIPKLMLYSLYILLDLFKQK